MSDNPLCHEMGVVELATGFKNGSLPLEGFYDALRQYGDAVEPQVQAFAHQSPEVVDAQRWMLQELVSSGSHLPALFGVPIGVKDNIDTADYPTELGFEGAIGRTPSVDAYLIHRLREAGAVVWGKTRTAELAYLKPPITTNPRNPAHTPGGSSSGSAAAVAAGMVPAAIGTQTNGSVIRPASFCGVHGFKPTRGLIFNGGVLACAPSLDQVGVFARSIEDVAAVAEVLIGGHESAQGRTVFPVSLSSLAKQEPPMPPKLMFVRTAQWDQMDPEAQQAFEALKEELADSMTEIVLPDAVNNATAWLRTVMDAEMHFNLSETVSKASLSNEMSELLVRGAQISASDYLSALSRCHRAAAGFDEYFDHFDAILTPASLGPAPKSLDSTGNPIMSTLWTFAGLPCISLPLLQTEAGMPIGVQLVGGLNADARLLRTARWLEKRLEA
ncbi:MAG: amidase [Burkholderiaceae bacterium]|jgi:Asp-tRNA(Asn)/Glu-tRNA(Gln) amidotransferase A subunit family amidase|nr:amidase [Burkholderiaceae bacterium]MDO7552585.1 amidase [Burkholderiaceae bacterium]MDO7580656.1 amidase [Burkholderiaceae bacterium]MDO7605960.1 amidase [Burkholderiaceae bacterium]MDO7671170.1 amidase [Burkholderiaceae bacterium]